jgi:uncharacterized protein
LFSTSTPTPTPTPPTNVQYLLRYSYIPDVLEKRGPFREQHIQLAQQLIDNGTCLSGGPVTDITSPKETTESSDVVPVPVPVPVPPPTGALFIFTNYETAQLFVNSDPYVQHGIVTNYTIESWLIVVSAATTK